MPFPPAERVIFDHNPLDLVVAQLRFPPILSIATQEPAAFQEPIRARFPLYSREDAIVIPAELEPMLAKLGRPPQSVRHAFRTLDQQRSVYLSTDFLAVEEKRYERWERFRDDFARVAATLGDLYAPVLFTRIGLRYINVIRRSTLGLSQDVPWATLVKPTFIGMLGHEDYRARIRESIAVTSIQLEVVGGGTVRIQHGLRPAGSEGSTEESYFIDADFFTEEHTNVADAINVLDAFHAHSGNLFRWVISDALYNALGPRPADGMPGPAVVGLMAQA